MLFKVIVVLLQSNHGWAEIYHRGRNNQTVQAFQCCGNAACSASFTLEWGGRFEPNVPFLRIIISLNNEPAPL
jgi:hypothetical protein